MDHGPAVEHEKDLASAYKTKIGFILFIVYGLIYAGFVGIATFSEELMGTILFFGLNLAIIYGWGLIILAIIMGLVYNALSTKKENELNGVAKKKIGAKK